MAIRIGLLGGTGVEGRGIALRFAHAGASVAIGSRSAERAREVAAAYNQALGSGAIEGLSNGEVLGRSDIVFLTLPYDQAPAALDALRAELPSGLVLVDVTVPMAFREGRAEYEEPAEGSNAERLALHLPPGVHLVGAFKTIPAHVMAEVQTPLDCDVYVCGDDAGARARVMDAARLIPTLRPVDAGPLRAARTLERMTVLAVNLNRRYKRKGARYRIQGIE